MGWALPHDTNSDHISYQRKKQNKNQVKLVPRSAHFLAMNHSEMGVINIKQLSYLGGPQLDGSESPWQLRFGEEFPAMHIPFGAKVLFWNNPQRATL
jgi:hypothetical protein